MGSIVSADQLPEAAEGKQGLSPGPVARTLASLSPPPTAASVPSDDSTSTSTALLTSAATFPPSSTVPNTEANVLESEEADEESGSPDAVQTLIDAVQELIQTHDQAGANK